MAQTQPMKVVLQGPGYLHLTQRFCYAGVSSHSSRPAKGQSEENTCHMVQLYGVRWVTAHSIASTQNLLGPCKKDQGIAAVSFVKQRSVPSSLISAQR